MRQHGEHIKVRLDGSICWRWHVLRLQPARAASWGHSV